MSAQYAVVIDAQVDFASGALANPAVIARLPYVAAEVRRLHSAGYRILHTLDTHASQLSDYTQTWEGHNFPWHCAQGTPGQALAEPVASALAEVGSHGIEKPTFGSYDLVTYLTQAAAGDPITELRLLGFVTEICVAANAILLRAAFPDTPIVVDAAGCAGLSAEGHQAGLAVMRAQLIEIVNAASA